MATAIPTGGLLKTLLQPPPFHLPTDHPVSRAAAARFAEQLRWRATGLLLASAAWVQAALPNATPPSTAPASGDWLGLIKGYVKDAGIVVGLAVAIAAFIWAAWAAIAKFNEARNGRAEWGEVGLLSVVAGGVLVLDSYLLGVAAGVI